MDEAHVEHSVGLVEHNGLHPVEPHGTALHVVGQAARGRHNDLRLFLQRVDLLANGRAAVEAHHADAAHKNGQVAQLRRDLHGKLARRRHDDRLHLLAFGVNVLDDGNAEGKGLAGVDLPRDKRIEIALTYIYGIGLTTSQRLLKETGINPDTRARDLTEDEVVKLRDIIDKQVIVEGDLRREQSLNIKRLVEIGCYRGRRHRMGLPVRGQNTKNNARTRKGPKKAVAGKKK